MTTEAASDRERQWVLVVRRSFGIPDLLGNEDARGALIGSLEAQLRENGWQRSIRAIAEPIADALMASGTSGDLDDVLLPVGRGLAAETVDTCDAAYRLIDGD